MHAFTSGHRRDFKNWISVRYDSWLWNEKLSYHTHKHGYWTCCRLGNTVLNGEHKAGVCFLDCCVHPLCVCACVCVCKLMVCAAKETQWKPITNPSSLVCVFLCENRATTRECLWAFATCFWGSSVVCEYISSETSEVSSQRTVGRAGIRSSTEERKAFNALHRVVFYTVCRKVCQKTNGGALTQT